MYEDETFFLLAIKISTVSLSKTQPKYTCLTPSLSEVLVLNRGDAASLVFLEV